MKRRFKQFKKDSNSMNETEFASLIDYNFPYNDHERAVALIDLANSVSDNAKFMFL